MSDSESDLPPPHGPGTEIASGYRVVAHMRRGEDLDVYDVWSDRRACRCVAKTLRPDRALKQRTRARLLREGRLLQSLTHPHVVRVYEVITSPEPLLIEETLPGETLAHLIDRQQSWLRAPDVAMLGIHLCSAIGYLHATGWLHLDIKPSNIVSSHGLAKVLDLSLARKPGCTRGGSGTPGYMAPEQVAGGELGPFTDVWGIGATLYEAATGIEACECQDESATVFGPAGAQKSICVPQPVRRLRRLPLPLATAIDAALSPAPRDRPTIAELGSHLAASMGLRPGFEGGGIGPFAADGAG
jgi:serine/threonine protein kinase